MLPIVRVVVVLLAQSAELAPPAKLSEECVRTVIADTQRRVTAIHVCYRSSGYGEKFPSGTYAYQEVAALSPSYALENVAHGHDVLDWKDDPLRRIFIVQPECAYNVSPLNRTYRTQAIDSRAPLPAGLDSGFFYVATGIWPLERPGFTIGGRPYLLRDIANSTEFSLRPTLERIHDSWCHVLENPKGDRLWCDAARGCALMARELDDPVTKATAQRYEMSKHVEMAPGVWIPTHIRTIQFDAAAKISSEQNRIILDRQVTIEKCCLNSLTPDFFNFTPPPGALLLKHRARPQQTHGGGLDHLDELVRWLHKYVKAPASSFSFPTIETIAAIAVGLALGSCNTGQVLTRAADHLFRRRLH